MSASLLVKFLLANLVVYASGLADDWNVPLFLWQADDGNLHTALLPEPPSAYIPVAAAAASNYTLVFEEPVAFAQSLPDDGCVSHPFVTLKLYYSSQRSDLQTSTWSLAQINAHGGAYEFVAILGTILTNPGSGYTAASFVPLTVSYNTATQDAATAPLSAADLNILLSLSGEDEQKEYQAGGVLTGFAVRGTCPACSVCMSETFPSAGGPDCAFPCNQYGHTGKDDVNFDTRFELGDFDSPTANALRASMLTANNVILSFGHKDVTVTPASRGTHIHMSFNYFCCYSAEDVSTLHAVLRAYDWPTVEVSFDRPTIRIDSDAEDVSHYSYILLLDTASQDRMHAVVDGVEAAVRAAGLDVHVPRNRQEPFHSTLAVVDGRNFPVVAALQAVDATVPPGSWTGGAGATITLGAPTWSK